MTSLEVARRLCGVFVEIPEKSGFGRLAQPDFSDWPDIVLGRDPLRRLASEVNQLLNESWSSHVRLLRKLALALPGTSLTSIRDLQIDAKTLRTLFEHPMDPNRPQDQKTVREAEMWFRQACGTSTPMSPEEWTSCGSHLFSQIEASLRELIGIAKEVQRSPSRSAEWHGLFTAESEVNLVSVREIVSGELGIKIQPGRSTAIDMRIKSVFAHHLANASAGQDVGVLARAVVATELLGSTAPPLPVDIEELGLCLDLPVGRRLLAAARLVQFLYERTELDSEGLLELTAQVWSVVDAHLAGETPP